jgi:hypothetical protein
MEKSNKTIHEANQDAIAELWPKFESLIPDNIAALEYVLEQLFENGMIRCHCGNNSPQNFVRIDLRILACRNCSRKIRFMANTCFRYVKQLKAWLGAIYLKERRVLVTSYRLTRLCNIASATAHNIVTTLGCHIQKELELRHCNAVHSAPLDLFLKVLFKRSLISGSFKHPSEPPDETTNESSQPKKQKNKKTSSSSQRNFTEEAEDHSDKDLSDTDRQVLESIRQSPTSQDSLCAITGMTAAQVASSLVMLEISGLIQAQPGNLFTLCKRNTTNSFTEELTESVRAIAWRAFNTIGEIYGGVSRKYLQLYLAAFWCHQDSAIWTEGALLSILLRGEPIQFQEILSYVSPLTVSLAPFKKSIQD